MSVVLPNHVLKLMTPEDRKKLGKAGVTSEEASAKQEARLERELQKDVLNYLALRGVKRVVSSRFGRKTTTPVGNPDLLFVHRISDGAAVPFAFELKSPTGKCSPEQIKAAHEFSADGWNYYLIRSLDEVKKILDQ